MKLDESLWPRSHSNTNTKWRLFVKLQLLLLPFVVAQQKFIK